MRIFLKLIMLLIFTMLLQGCLSQIASIDKYTEAWLGRPLSEKVEMIERPTSYASRIDWNEETYKLENGNTVYIEPDRPDCFIHWEVDSDGIIVGYKTVGGRCY